MFAAFYVIISVLKIYTTFGLELASVSVIDSKLNTVYEKFVKPDHPVTDYNTRYGVWII